MLAVASDGKNYAIPSSGFWENMFVNTKVLSDCGVAVPGPDYTWDQFLADCQTEEEHVGLGARLKIGEHLGLPLLVGGAGGVLHPVAGGVLIALLIRMHKTYGAGLHKIREVIL